MLSQELRSLMADGCLVIPPSNQLDPSDLRYNRRWAQARTNIAGDEQITGVHPDSNCALGWMSVSKFQRCFEPSEGRLQMIELALAEGR